MNEKVKLIINEMKNDEFSDTLELRTRKFAVAILKLSIELTKNPLLEESCEMLVRAGVNVGASYWEAYRMVDGEDFLCYISYCEEDIRETIRWLKIMDELQVADAITMISLLYEARELHGVFLALLKNRKLAG